MMELDGLSCAVGVFSALTTVWLFDRIGVQTKEDTEIRKLLDKIEYELEQEKENNE